MNGINGREERQQSCSVNGKECLSKKNAERNEKKEVCYFETNV